MDRENFLSLVSISTSLSETDLKTVIIELGSELVVRLGNCLASGCTALAEHGW